MDAQTARESIAEDGFFVARAILDPATVSALRARFLGVMSDEGWLDAGFDSDPSTADNCPREGGDGWWQGYEALQKIEAFHRLAWDASLFRLMEELFAEKPMVHPRKILAITKPAYYVPPHQDYVSVQGTVDCFSVWIPLEDRPDKSAVTEFFLPPGARRLYPLRWVQNVSAECILPQGVSTHIPDLRVGDAVVYHSLTVHSVTPNMGASIRLAVEIRYQSPSGPIASASLKPHHYPRILDWPDLTATWRSPRWVEVPAGIESSRFVMPERLEDFHRRLPIGMSRFVEVARRPGIRQRVFSVVGGDKR